MQGGRGGCGSDASAREIFPQAPDLGSGLRPGGRHEGTEGHAVCRAQDMGLSRGGKPPQGSVKPNQIFQGMFCELPGIMFQSKYQIVGKITEPFLPAAKPAAGL